MPKIITNDKKEKNINNLISKKLTKNNVLYPTLTSGNFNSNSNKAPIKSPNLNLLNSFNKSANKKIFEEKEKENAIKIIKDKYIHKENEYIITMHTLQEEIYSLIKLLDRNKNYYNKFKEVEKEINESNTK